ncbi:ankyrin repeat and sterile alpha motif domain-containing protein 1B [Bacillus rossius redtenbacheri]|uniref:ankyrin repeat and sterile alpha motif domain-containing protein 1B n=1 Tax=Bacillus rossius redtenbacheri TaxID=93214 RepID=UPI002FDD3355
MGKDQELLEAARNGNISVVEKILNQRAKRSGPLASLRRGPGANVQDNSGYSALHHAALNGHKDVVKLLLTHEASTNIVDGKGSSPLHLAAWTGNVDVVRLLLCHGPSVPNVNLTTKDNETALHCAAQYGHTAVVGQLLEHSCDPTIRSAREETALDLAAQYGRLETVELLVRTHPELLQPYSRSSGAVFPHTPLHLASRNGHKAVVEVLLTAGLAVNARTPAGTALHEAALCGKVEVVRTLLDAGVDLGARDVHRNTVADLLAQFPKHVTQEITDIIDNHRRTSVSSRGSQDADCETPGGAAPLPPIPVPDAAGPGSPYENVRLSGLDCSPSQWDCMSGGADCKAGLLPDRQRRHSSNQRDADQMSVSSTASSAGRSDAAAAAAAAGFYVPMAAAHSPGSGSKVSPTPPKKPPRRNLSVSPTHAQPCMTASADGGGGGGGGAYEYLFLARSGVRSQCDPGDAARPLARLGRSVDQYVDMRPPSAQPVAITCMYENVPLRTQNPRRKLRRGCSDRAAYENVAVDDDEHDADDASSTFVSSAHITLRSSRESLLDGAAAGRPLHEEAAAPTSPTHYRQPPTPDHPPPSALQAEKSIHDRIRPLSQEYKRRSRDMETETEDDLLLFPGSLGASSGSLSSSVSLSDKSVSTDNNVEEFLGDAPFAGLLKGSTAQEPCHRAAPAERPKTLRRLRSVYESAATPGCRLDGPEDAAAVVCRRAPPPSSRGGGAAAAPGAADKSLSILSPFDEQEEWAKISEIMASFGSDFVRDSLFVSELEREFQSRLGLNRSASNSPVVGSAVGQWLASLGLAEYESVFHNHGFDDLDFINGVLEEQDLADMGVAAPADAAAILEAARALPAKAAAVAAAAGGGEDDEEGAVDAWLRAIGLGGYADTFRRHLYRDMGRVRRVWEVELTAVLEIHKAGHRRRILAAVSGQPRGPDLEGISADLSLLKCNIQQLKEEIKEKLPAPGGGGTLRHSHKKSRPAPPPPGSAPAAPAELQIREPSELLVGVPATLTTQWRHHPRALLSGAVTYLANYLGSTVVKELRGTESTKKSIQKLKKATKEPKTSPDIVLAISYHGVQFLNPADQELVCEHEIRNIHCACQDADDLTHFAYITKDHASKSHYCHVFCVLTMDQATEVILTLGQAFEVAYQMALRDQAPPAPAAARNGHTRSQSANQILPLLAAGHARSLSVDEVRLNGQQESAPPPAPSAPHTPKATTPSQAPIVQTEEL